MTHQIADHPKYRADCVHIYRRGICWAILIALCYGGLHYASLAPFFHHRLLTFSSFYVFFTPEILVCLGGLSFLLVGTYLQQKHPAFDEGETAHSYYLAALKVMVVLAFGSYAFTLPFSSARLTEDVPQNYLVLLFETVGVIYLYHSFKKHDVFFNYSFIHAPKRAYYKLVLLNMVKLSLWVLPFFAAAAGIELLLHGVTHYILTILITWPLSLFGLGLEYLFISWTEKMSYDEKEHRGLHIGTFVKFLFLLGNTLLALLVTFLLLYIIHGNSEWLLSLLGISELALTEELSSAQSHFSHESSVLTPMVLCKFMCQIRHCRKGRGAISGMVLLTVVTLFWDYLMTFTIVPISRMSQSAAVWVLSVSTVAHLVFTLFNALLWTVLVWDLIKKEGLSSLLWLVVGARWILAILPIISTRIPTLSFFYAFGGGILGFGALILLLILLHRHQYPHEHEEFV